MRIFDAHCHLDQLPDPEEAVRKARQSGVDRILSVSEDKVSGIRALELKSLFPAGVLVGLGVHPALFKTLTPQKRGEEITFIEDRIAEADVVGEVGLDFKHAVTPGEKKDQAQLLEEMLALARAAGKPINLHSRRSQREVMERAIQYKRETGLNALLHWFTSSKKLARICAEEGIYISVGPSIFFPGPAAEVGSMIPDHLLLVETDSPVVYDGEAAEPVWSLLVLEKLAELRKIRAPMLAGILNENFDRYLSSR